MPQPAGSPSDPRYDGFRITTLWAWTAVDPADDQEGIVGLPQPAGGALPMIASDRVALDRLRPLAELIANVNRTTLYLRRFGAGEDTAPVDTIHPAPRPGDPT